MHPRLSNHPQAITISRRSVAGTSTRASHMDMDMDMDMHLVPQCTIQTRPSQLNGLTHKPGRSRCPPPHLLAPHVIERTCKGGSVECGPAPRDCIHLARSPKPTRRRKVVRCFQNYYTLSQHSVTALNRSFFPLKSAEKKAQSRKIFFAGRCPAPRRGAAPDPTGAPPQTPAGAVPQTPKSVYTPSPHP